MSDQQTATRATPLLGERTWWRCLVAEWVTPPPQSEWTRLVNDDRIVNLDRVRPFATRAALLAMVLVCVLISDGPSWVLALLGIGALQTVLELIYEPVVRARHEATALGEDGTDLIVRAWYRNYGTGIANVTGLLGIGACVAVLWLVIWGTGPADDQIGFKVAALTAAVLYVVSGVLGPLTDGAAYDVDAKIPRRFWVLLRWAWVPVAGLLVGMLLLADRSDGAWGPALPYACLCTLLAYYPMLRVREYERALAAGWHVAELLYAKRTEQVALDLHTMLQPVKTTLLTARDALDDPTERRKVSDYLEDVSAVYHAARTGAVTSRDGFMPPVEVYLDRIVGGAMIDLEATIDLDLTVPDTDYRLARQILATCVENSVQAYVAWAGTEYPSIQATARMKSGELVVEVTDLMPFIPGDVWVAGEGALGVIRRSVEAGGGTLKQSAVGEGKMIRAAWRPLGSVRVLSGKEAAS